MKELLDGLTKVERAIVKERFLAKNPMPLASFIQKHKIKDKDTLRCLEAALLRKIKGELPSDITKTMMNMRLTMERLGTEKMRHFRRHSTEIERRIMNNRAKKRKGRPETLKQIGNEFGYCREGIRLIERKLLLRLQEYERTGKIPARIKPGPKPNI